MPVVEFVKENVLKNPKIKPILSEASYFAKQTVARMEWVDPFKEVFPEVEFETTAYCNRKCEYCPNVEFERFGASDGFYMKEEVFETLIQQLADIGFKGQIAPHLYGEPLTDPRIVRWITHMRKMLPEVRIKIVTNGDFLNKEKFDQLLDAGLDVLFLSKHSDKLRKGSRELLESLPEDIKEKHIVYNDFYTDYHNDQTMFTNRGGEVELKSEKSGRPPIMCVYATYPVINTHGDLTLCCQDFHSKHINGNIMERHLRDIWWDPKNIELRTRIYQGHFDIPICKDCRM